MRRTARPLPFLGASPTALGAPEGYCPVLGHLSPSETLASCVPCMDDTVCHLPATCWASRRSWCRGLARRSFPLLPPSPPASSRPGSAAAPAGALEFLLAGPATGREKGPLGRLKPGCKGVSDGKGTEEADPRAGPRSRPSSGAASPPTRSSSAAAATPGAPSTKTVDCRFVRPQVSGALPVPRGVASDAGPKVCTLGLGRAPRASEGTRGHRSPRWARTARFVFGVCGRVTPRRSRPDGPFPVALSSFLPSLGDLDFYRRSR